MYSLSCESYDTLNDIEVQTIDGNIVNINNSFSKAIIVFSGLPACNTCYRDINEISKILNSNGQDEILVIALIPFDAENHSTAYHLRYIEQFLKQDTSFFDIPDGISSKLFNKFAVDNLPSVLLLNNNRVKYFSSNDLFDNNNIEQNTKIFRKFFK